MDEPDLLMEVLQLDFENYKQLLRLCLDNNIVSAEGNQLPEPAKNEKIEHLQQEVENLRVLIFGTNKKKRVAKRPQFKVQKILCLKMPSKSVEASFMRVDFKSGEFHLRDQTDVTKYKKYTFDGIFTNYQLGLLDDYFKRCFLDRETLDYFLFINGAQGTNKKEIAHRMAMLFMQIVASRIDSHPGRREALKVRISSMMGGLYMREISASSSNWRQELVAGIEFIKVKQIELVKLLGQDESSEGLNATFTMIELCETVDYLDQMDIVSSRLQRMLYLCICSTEKNYDSPATCVKETVQLCRKNNYEWSVRRLHEKLDSMKQLVVCCVDTIYSRVFACTHCW